MRSELIKLTGDLGGLPPMKRTNDWSHFSGKNFPGISEEYSLGIFYSFQRARGRSQFESHEDFPSSE